MSPIVLFAEFFKIGLFSIGGGLATLPFIYRLTYTIPRLTAEMVPDMLAVAQSLPGAIGVNLGIYTGFRCAGIPGAAAAALGLVLPSVIIIMIIAGMLRAFKDSPVVQAVFAGLRPAAAGLLCAAFLLVLRVSLWNAGADAWYRHFRLPECTLFIVLFLLTRKVKLHPFFWIAAAGIAGVVLKL
ncbi:MAG: chromate transporter [Spirochaetaceae bacterium]|jgi:chromate transporter|nr:chromate transporter [Spirochaetaceae bacterium]